LRPQAFCSSLLNVKPMIDPIFLVLFSFYVVLLGKIN